jgi:hypothetical protein
MPQSEARPHDRGLLPALYVIAGASFAPAELSVEARATALSLRFNAGFLNANLSDRRGQPRPR